MHTLFFRIGVLNAWQIYRRIPHNFSVSGHRERNCGLARVNNVGFKGQPTHSYSMVFVSEVMIFARYSDVLGLTLAIQISERSIGLPARSCLCIYLSLSPNIHAGASLLHILANINARSSGTCPQPKTFFRSYKKSKKFEK